MVLNGWGGVSNIKHQPISVYASAGWWSVDTKYLDANGFHASPWTKR